MKRFPPDVPKVATTRFGAAIWEEAASAKFPLEKVLDALPPVMVVKRIELLPPEMTTLAGVADRVRRIVRVPPVRSKPPLVSTRAVVDQVKSPQTETAGLKNGRLPAVRAPP